MKLTIQQWTSPKSSNLLNTLKNFRRKWPLQYITFCPVLTQHLFQQSLVPCCALWKKNVHGHLKIFFRLNSDAFVQYNTLGALWNNAIQTLQLINTEKSFFSSVSPLLYSETSICYMQVDPDNVFFAAFLLSGPFIVIFLHRNFTPCI